MKNGNLVEIVYAVTLQTEEETAEAENRAMT